MCCRDCLLPASVLSMNLCDVVPASRLTGDITVAFVQPLCLLEVPERRSLLARLDFDEGEIAEFSGGACPGPHSFQGLGARGRPDRKFGLSPMLPGRFGA